MKKLFTLLLCSFSVYTFSQNFSHGYYIDQNNKKNIGYLEDTNPLNSPEKILFKTTPQEQAVEIAITNVKEFKIDTDYKFVRYTIDYDFEQSLNNNDINIYGKEPKLKQKEVLVKVLIEGQESLYKAIIGDAVFFYIKDDKEENPKLLVHRKYNFENAITDNNDFRKQLYERMQSNKLVMADFLNINYDEKELVSIFNKFNKENNSLVNQGVDVNRNKNKFYCKVFGGVSLFTMSYDYLGHNFKSSNSSSNPLIGFELSNVLGTNGKRSEFFARLFYQKVKNNATYHETTNVGYDINENFKANYSALNVSAGYRYAFIKRGENKLFIDGSVGASTLLNGDFSIYHTLAFNIPNQPDPAPITYLIDNYAISMFFNLGLGYSFNNKYALNFEYSSKKNYLSNYGELSGGFSNFNLLFTYTLNK